MNKISLSTLSAILYFALFAPSWLSQTKQMCGLFSLRRSQVVFRFVPRSVEHVSPTGKLLAYSADVTSSSFYRKNLVYLFPRCAKRPQMWLDLIFRQRRHLLTGLNYILAPQSPHYFVNLFKIELISARIACQIHGNYGSNRKCRKTRSWYKDVVVPVKSGFCCFKTGGFRTEFIMF